jgi:prepilin-type N-terminal cleavage/methylation domain-containing protein
MKNTNRGFTLIELMITVAILAIISAIAIPAYTGYIKTAKLQEASNNFASLRIAQEEYFMENNTYFGGTDTATVEANSSGLWKAVKGSETAVAFKYEVTASATTWSAIATGNLSGSTAYGEKVKAKK